MLLLTAAASVWTLVGVKPNYIATAYVQLVPPVTHPTEPGQQSADQRNPWLGLGLNTLANAAVVTVQDDTVIEALHKAGYSDTFTATLNSATPLVTFEITGSSQTQAAATANELVARYDQSVADLQSTYGALQSDYVTTRRLDLGTNLEASNARVKRALVAVAGVGLLLTIAFTVGIDAIIRRRSRLRGGLAAADLPPPLMVERSPARRLERPAVTRSAAEQSPVVWTFSESPRVGANGGNGSGSLHGNGTTGGVALSVDTQSQSQSPEPATTEMTPSASGSASGAMGSSDTTVVLPLSFKAWRQRDSTEEEGNPPR